ncbi:MULTISPECIES: TolC family protein [Stenotrophomonas]|uniref:TolC family protein n=1 Tax=Stenotrophomonas aracearum TaxID=3003272 RepID=A0ABY9YHZ3_9GAMM|nr:MULTISPECIES: TolC family protein [unclassified Stenotrophomonas]MBW8373131.1 TolC family protein [Stenotrophomonas sp.]WNH50484.1 TolC family protein [Stenotrophomonas sp. A5588]
MHFVRLPRRRFAVRLACAMALALALSMPAAAADSSAPAAPPAIREALQSAWQHHPAYRATEAQLTAARARLDAARQPLHNPELELASEDEGSERTSTAGLNLTLDLSGKRRVRRDAAAARVDLATAEARLRRRDFAKQWFGSWAALQTATARVRTGEKRLVLMSRFAQLAQKQFAADDISGLERDLALLAQDEAQAEQAQLIAEQAEAEARFRAVGGSPELLANLVLPSATLSPPIRTNLGIDQLADWQVAQATALAAEREVTVARRDRIADPKLGAYGGRKQYDFGGPSENVYGVTLTVPLFVRNSYRAEVVAAQAEADAATADAERVRLELEADRRRAIDSYAAAQSSWTRWQASRGTDVERRTTLLERLWREGELSTADYLQQLKQTVDTQLAGAELEARLWRSYADYLAATGQLERWAGLEGTP